MYKYLLTVIGIGDNISDFLYPIKLPNKPNDNVPNTAPKDKTDPIQLFVSVDNGPSTNGVSSDNKSGKTGEYQPRLHPRANDIKFPRYHTVKENIRKILLIL